MGIGTDVQRNASVGKQRRETRASRAKLGSVRCR